MEIILARLCWHPDLGLDAQSSLAGLVLAVVKAAAGPENRQWLLAPLFGMRREAAFTGDGVGCVTQPRIDHCGGVETARAGHADAAAVCFGGTDGETGRCLLILTPVPRKAGS